MKWSCCEGGNVLLWENSESSARQMEGVARALGESFQSKQLEYYCFTHSDHILHFSPRYHLLPCVVLTCPRYVWGPPWKITLASQVSLRPPPPHLETWASVSFSLSPVFTVIVGFLFSSRQWCFRDHMILNSLPNRNVHLLKKPYQIFSKACVPRQNDHPWCRMVRYGGRVIEAPWPCYPCCSDPDP